VPIDRELDLFPIRQPATARIVTDEGALFGKQREPGLPYRILPVQIEVTYPIRSTDQRRSGAVDCIGDAGAVAAFAKADLLGVLAHCSRRCSAGTLSYSSPSRQGGRISPLNFRRLALGNRYPVIGVRADALEQPTSWEKETLNFYPPIASSRVPPLHR
jgi:hypothetical protein